MDVRPIFIIWLCSPFSPSKQLKSLQSSQILNVDPSIFTLLQEYTF